MARTHLIWAAALVFSVFVGTSIMGVKTTERAAQVKSLAAKIKSDQAKIAMLDKELAVLAAPERLKKIVDDHAMALTAPTADQILVSASDLAPLADAAPPMLAQAPAPPRALSPATAAPLIIAWQAPAPLQQSLPAPAFTSRDVRRADVPANIVLASAPRRRMVSFAEPESISSATRTPIARPEPEIVSLPPRVAEVTGAVRPIKKTTRAAPVIHQAKLEKPAPGKNTPAEPTLPRLSSSLINQINAEAAQEMRK